MKQKSTVIKIFTLINLLCIEMAFAEQVGQKLIKNQLTDADIELNIKPNICVAPRGKSNCISSMDISWTSTKVGDFCLYSHLSDQPLNCWESSDSGFYRHKINIKENLDYWMTAFDSIIQVANVTVKYAALKPHRKHARRRNRLPWSIQSL